MNALLASARYEFHEQLCRVELLSMHRLKRVNSPAYDGPAYSNADASSLISLNIAASIAQQLEAAGHSIPERETKIAGQTAGRLFEEAVAEFVKRTFPALRHIRPGRWGVGQLGNTSVTNVSHFAQYEHLEALSKLKRGNPELQAALGNDYIVAPDVIVWRDQCDDEEINATEPIVDDVHGARSALRKSDLNTRPILHASISAKFTMRSDRAQNSRTEALNLIRNRKGHLPHIVVVTAEPSPSRLASLALGTGDIDCVYHFALDELEEAVERTENEVAQELMATLVVGKRLKDISDLPLDLAV
ncbi:MAG: hypothetical protein IKG21_08200 [Atopobiaceae bacterium]|nr:hypothetical protein [Atopobiaceae bacterium]